MRVQAPGFKKIERGGVKISTNETVTREFAMELGAATESVTVSAAAG